MSRWCASAQRPGQNRTPRLASASRWPLRRQPAISSWSRSGRISRVDAQLHADLSARGPAKPKCRRHSFHSGMKGAMSRWCGSANDRDKILRPQPWALDVTRNAGACDAPRRRLLANQPVQNANIRVTSPEATERAENPWNSAIINLARARARGAGLFNPRCRPGRTTSVRVHTR